LISIKSACGSTGAQSFFLKQPVAKASISRDPLTLRVPMNGAKSDRLLAANPVAAPVFGAVERLVSGLDDFVRHGEPVIAFGNADADGHGYRFFRLALAALFFS
jgi:hypothetical protein